MKPTQQSATFVALWSAHGPRVYSYIFSLVGSWPDADDVYQETSVVLLEKFDEFEPGTNFLSTPGRLSLRERWAESWESTPIQGDVPKGGLIAVSGDVAWGDQWWFVFADGLYCSANGGKSLRKVFDQLGKQ